MTADKLNNSDPQMCRQCQGLCCQGHPGVWTNPERFLSSFDLPRPTTPEILRSMLPRELELREIDHISLPAPKATENGCIFLDKEGCILPKNRRPEQCLALTPKVETLIAGEIHCELEAGSSTLTAMRNWKAFWEQNPTT